MENTIIQLIENRSEGYESDMITVTPQQMKEIEKDKHSKGFKAFDIDIYRETNRPMRMKDIRAYKAFKQLINY